jgi:CheY-like chemotaxis protein
MLSESANLAFSYLCEPAIVNITQAPVGRSVPPVAFRTLPLIEPREPGAGRIGQAAAPPSAASDIRSVPRHQAALLVDDDPQVARALAVILGSRQIHLMTATSVAKAIKALETCGADIAVMIANLGPTGHALSLLAARRYARHRAPVVVMKAVEDHRGWMAAVSAGAAAFVDCPIDPTEMQLAVMRVCG